MITVSGSNSEAASFVQLKTTTKGERYIVTLA